MINWIKSRFKKQKKPTEIAYYAEQIEDLPKEKLREMGRLKAELAQAKRQNKVLQKTIEQHKKPEKQRITEEIKKQQKQFNKEKKENLVPLNKISKNTRILSKDHRILGYFKQLAINKRGNLTIIVTPHPGKGREYSVFEAQDLKTLIHHSESLAHMIKAQTIILNRNYNGDYIPDIDAHLPAAGAEIYRKTLGER